MEREPRASERALEHGFSRAIPYPARARRWSDSDLVRLVVSLVVVRLDRLLVSYFYQTTMYYMPHILLRFTVKPKFGKNAGPRGHSCRNHVPTPTPTPALAHAPIFALTVSVRACWPRRCALAMALPFLTPGPRRRARRSSRLEQEGDGESKLRYGFKHKVK